MDYDKDFLKEHTNWRKKDLERMDREHNIVMICLGIVLVLCIVVGFAAGLK